MTYHDPKCACFNGSCCPWIRDCECQCMCDFINSIRNEYAGLIEAYRNTLWKCIDCGNLYDSTVELCPNESLDQLFLKSTCAVSDFIV
jgi:hypothetical protein